MKDDKLEELFAEYKYATNLSTAPTDIKKLKANHIEDDNKSVKWNREFVEDNNNKYWKSVSRLQRQRSLQMNKAKSKIVKYIQKKSGTNEECAKAALELATYLGHRVSIDYVALITSHLIDVISLCGGAR